MKNRKFYTCCFSGHRPKNLPWKYNEKSNDFLKFKLSLQKIIEKTIEHGYFYFISGMALGIDIICAELILELKKKHPHIQLECAIPCKNQTKKWSNQYITRYNNILTKSDTIYYITNNDYTNNCMQLRNKYMIEQSSLLIAIYNGSNGGTKQTIQYARQNKLNVIILNPNDHCYDS